MSTDYYTLHKTLMIRVTDSYGVLFIVSVIRWPNTPIHIQCILTTVPGLRLSAAGRSGVGA